MQELTEYKTQIEALSEAMDRVADKIADTQNDPIRKEALVRQYNELKKQRDQAELKFKEVEMKKAV
jgi:hypothetical protein